MFRICALIFAALSPCYGGTGGMARPPARVLYLGDSLSIGAFGRTFDAALRSEGFQVHTVAAGGASPYHWLRNYQSLPCTVGYWEKSESNERREGCVPAVPKLEDLMSETKPDVVVVQTGVNLYATLRSQRRPKQENVAEVRSLIDQMCRSISDGGAVSYWILPPRSHENRYSRELQEELAALMRGVVASHGEMVFESRAVTEFADPYPATDGIHYRPAEAAGWAEKALAHFNAFMGSGESPALAETKAEALVQADPMPGPVRTEPPPPPTAAPQSGGGEGTPAIPDEVTLRIRLEKKSEIENAAQLDDANALGLYEYRVVEDLRGNYPHERIRIAQGIVFARKLTGAAKARIGSETELDLVPLSKYRSLSSWQMIDQLRPDFEIPIYTPKLD